MNFPKSYPFLKNSCISEGEYSIVPIRFEDRIDIMKWRNEQIYHLRQSEPLTEEKQNDYFKNIVSKLFEQEKPRQILFSYLRNGQCIGYGGLVHTNWIDKNAEISFLLNTHINSIIENYIALFELFLKLLEKVAYQLKLHKIYTYGYDIADYRFIPIINSKFELDACLKEHVKINESFFDVKIYSKILY